MARTAGNVSAAHVSKTLHDAGYPRADDRDGVGVSGFAVIIEPYKDGLGIVTVRYQDYDYEHCQGNAAYELVARICEEAFGNYTRALRAAGYTVENWKRYDGIRLGLFVTGRR